MNDDLIFHLARLPEEERKDLMQNKSPAEVIEELRDAKFENLLSKGILVDPADLDDYDWDGNPRWD